MPRKRRIPKKKRSELTIGKICQLEFGHDYFGDGYGDELTAAVLAEMRRDWQQRGARILAEFVEQRPGSRPYAWWRFERGMKYRPDDDEQADLLERMGLLSKEERAAMEQPPGRGREQRGRKEESDGS
jgi:hypothetical protein